jgi:hypothetical protein
MVSWGEDRGCGKPMRRGVQLDSLLNFVMMCIVTREYTYYYSENRQMISRCRASCYRRSAIEQSVSAVYQLVGWCPGHFKIEEGVGSWVDQLLLLGAAIS